MATIAVSTTSHGLKRYKVMIRMQGHPQETQTFGEKKMAEAWAQKREGEIRLGMIDPVAASRMRSSKRLVKDMIAEYLEELPRLPNQHNPHNKIMHLDWWTKQLGAYSIGSVTVETIRTIRKRLEQGEISASGRRPSNGTVNRYMNSLSACYSWAQGNLTWVPENPVQKLSRLAEPPGRCRYLDPDLELPRVLEAARAIQHPLMETAILAAIATGLRRTNLLHLRWQDYKRDPGRQGLCVLRTKNGLGKYAPLRGEALEAIERLYATRRKDSDLIFPGDGFGTRKPFALDKPWSQVLVLAGVKDFHWHDLRHTGASYLAMSGASIPELLDYLNSKTPSMAMRYAHLMEAHSTMVIERMVGRFMQVREVVQP